VTAPHVAAVLLAILLAGVLLVSRDAADADA
jgi:hypothetical protein